MSALKIKKGSNSHSAYNLRPNFSDVIERHTLAVLVENEPGVLARVIGLFSGRGYNIDSLTVAEVDHTGHLSRITIVTSGTPQGIEQIKAQLGRIVPVHEVHDLTVEGPVVERELAHVDVVRRLLAAGEGEVAVEHGLGLDQRDEVLPVDLEVCGGGGGHGVESRRVGGRA